ncbi:hypothetical protein SASPL_142870 [Salvia splendens]|uniref:HMA domain-containing protein n=1 Tax=Salvia splendens TaxID=180675 RepID=A0A8X8WMI5_SALSN|nr:heavy metal-associated isoprenylated plant protein 21-like [Salvia splendens]KAG6396714.1 hypothetical protein SASPL_142870 [Salvia splendens]
MGIIDHISDLFTVSSTRKSKRKPMQTVDLRVKMDCDGCERRVRHAVSSMKGARSVEVNRRESHVAVTGHVEEKKVIKRIKRCGKRAEAWPYVEYNLTYHPYAPGAYDKKAPSGFVRDVDQAYPSPNELKYATFFSDDNVNACSIM